MHSKITIIGSGLAGSEAALQLAGRGHHVRLFDMKPEQKSPAHHETKLAEIVCSNSFGSQGDSTASGLVKQEMMQLGCQLLQIAQSVSVPAGKALAVDREAFSQAVTETIQTHPLIEFICQDITEIPQDTDFLIIATGPLTSPGLVQSIAKLLEREQLYFFDAASPIVVRDSINFDIAFYQDRYSLEKGGLANDSPLTNPSQNLSDNRGVTENDGTNEGSSDNSYINCPLDKATYQALVAKLLDAEKTELKDFEKESAQYFESCMPVEVIASRGPETLRYGPMKPVGLIDPHTGEQPHAVVQLRQDNLEGTLYNIVGFQTNLKWGEQKEMIQMIPGLENAEVVRYGVMHRNTYIHSPEVLQPTLQLKKHPHIFFAGQLTGTEGYTESIATGLIAAMNIHQLLNKKPALVLPRDTMLGALLHYITRAEAIGKSFQPINSNWGILPELPKRERNKKRRNEIYVARALASLKEFIETETLSIQERNKLLSPAGA